jgi:2-dehydro-3-deoxyphosphogluconate aldolase / (4S)-4-hydroxy-2-oxoglutarate aldolase
MEAKVGATTREQIVARIQEIGAVAVIRMTDSKKLLRVSEAIHEGGVSAIEVTMTVPNALQMIEEVARELGDEVVVGVGSVLNAETARQAIEAGARYVVSPVFKAEVVDEAHRLGVAVMPGAFTPTECLTAQEYGADVVKVFPADVLGIDFFKGVKAPMPHLRLMPTGGVTLTNAGDWIKAGACAVGVGSALLDKKAIEAESWGQLTENARTLIQSVRQGQGR